MASSCSTTSFPFELEFSYSVCSHIQFTFTYRDTCAYTSTNTAMWLCPSLCKEWIYIAANQMKITNSTAQKENSSMKLALKSKRKKDLQKATAWENSSLNSTNLNISRDNVKLLRLWDLISDHYQKERISLQNPQTRNDPNQYTQVTTRTHGPRNYPRAEIQRPSSLSSLLNLSAYYRNQRLQNQ